VSIRRDRRLVAQLDVLSLPPFGDRSDISPVPGSADDHLFRLSSGQASSMIRVPIRAVSNALRQPAARARRSRGLFRRHHTNVASPAIRIDSSILD